MANLRKPFFITCASSFLFKVLNKNYENNKMIYPKVFWSPYSNKKITTRFQDERFQDEMDV